MYSRKTNNLTSAEISKAGVAGKQGGIVGCAVAVTSIKLASDCGLLTAAGLGADTGGCCFFFKASCEHKKCR